MLPVVTCHGPHGGSWSLSHVSRPQALLRVPSAAYLGPSHVFSSLPGAFASARAEALLALRVRSHVSPSDSLSADPRKCPRALEFAVPARVPAPPFSVPDSSLPPNGTRESFCNSALRPGDVTGLSAMVLGPVWLLCLLHSFRRYRRS